MPPPLHAAAAAAAVTTATLSLLGCPCASTLQIGGRKGGGREGKAVDGEGEDERHAEAVKPPRPETRAPTSTPQTPNANRGRGGCAVEGVAQKFQRLKKSEQKAERCPVIENYKSRSILNNS